MTAAEAKKVVDAARTRKTCVRYRVGADGMVMFAPNGAPVASPIFGLKPIALGLGLLAGAAAFSSTQPVMGEIAPPAIAQPQTPPFVVEREVMGKLAVERPIVIKPTPKKAPPPPPRHEEIMGDLAIGE
jgi:hypothetical protein